MKTTLKTLAFFTALACIAPVQATVLLSRPPTAGGTYSDYGPPRQFVANRYKLPGANGYADITKITLYGYWAFVPVTFAFQSLTCIHLSDVNGVPGAPSGLGGLSQFGTQVGANILYRYVFNLPTPLRVNLGQNYWLHFGGNSAFNFGNTLTWAGTADLNGESRLSFNGYYTGYDAIDPVPNHAFELEGTVTITGPAVIAGHVGLQGWASSNGTSATIEIIQDGNVVETLSTPVAADGSFSTTTSHTGAAELRIRVPHFLQKRTGTMTLGFETAAINLPLTNGDIDGDNSIDIADYSILSANFNSENAPGDLNEDGFVDVGDYSILSSNYGLLGDD